MSPVLPLVLLLAGVPGIEHGVAAERKGAVVAAPHEGFDDNTGPMARAVGRALGWGWVIADGFRSRAAGRWINVNRPSERPWTGDGFGRTQGTRRAAKVYASYQEHVDLASGRTPLDVMVEIHGHARTVETEDGGRMKVQAIELATRGFELSELKALRARYRELVAELDASDRVPLAVEQIDTEYEFAGYTIPFYFGASGAKQDGSLSPERTAKALHFEFPQKVRLHADRRERYVKLLIELLRPLGESADDGGAEAPDEDGAGGD